MADFFAKGNKPINGYGSNLVNAKRRFIVISDSYGLGRDSQTPFTTYLGNILSGSDYYTYSEGSMGIYHVGESGHNAEELLTVHSSDISNHSTITDIIFALGINDYAETKANIDSAFGSLDSYLSSEYPNAKIWFAWIGNSYSVARISLITTYQNYLKNINAYKYSYCDGVQNIMHNNKFILTDGVHPTSDGGEEIAKGIYTCLMGDKYKYYVVNTATITPTTGSAGTAVEIIDGDSYSILFSDIYNSGSLSFTSSFFKFGQLSNNILRGTDWGNGSVSTSLSNATSFPSTVDICISNSEVKIRNNAFLNKTVAGLQINKPIITGQTMLI